MPNLDEVGLDLLDKMLRSNPSERITAKEAMKHPYLADVPDHIKNMKWSIFYSSIKLEIDNWAIK